jgi:DNA-binding MarR family transcriptional regulator
MSEAQTRLYHLTPAQKKVLAHIEICKDSHDRLIQSTREIAEGTNISQSAVLRALAGLNDLQLIWTTPGTPKRPSEHSLLFGSVRLGREPGSVHRRATAGGSR